MDAETVKLWLQGINMIGTFSLGCWLYIEKRADKTNARVSELAARVENVDRDLSALQSTVAAVPSHADLSKVYDSINTLAGTVHQLVGENRGQSDTLRLILNRITEKGMK